MKTVFSSNAMLAHVWAQETQRDGRSQSMSFTGKTLYSYNTPIAVIHDTPKGKIVLSTSNRYSVTTSGKHMPALTRAWDGKRVSVPVLHPSDQDHIDNLAYLKGLYDAEYKSGLRRRDEVTVWLFKHLQDNINTYCCYFELEAPLYNPDLDVAFINNNIREHNRLNSTPEAIAKREKDRARRIELREAKEHAAKQEQIVKFLSGESHSYFTVAGNALLRVKGEELETSQGATVPLDHAIKAFHFIKQVKDKAQAWERNGHTLHVGHFQVDSIDIEGNIKAGCHTINWAEIERIAKAIEIY